MKTAFQIFRRDVRRLLKNRAATLVMIGVCLLPSLYAWFNIAANMDPYANTSGIRVAIANCDTGAKTDVITMNAGDSIVEKLKENKSLGWQFVSEEKAKEGVQAGDYYAAIVIPENFSSSLVSILSGDLKRPKLDYYVNEKKNAIAPKITDTGATTVQQQINDTFSATASSAVSEIVKSSADSITRGLDDTQSELTSAITEVQNNLTDYQKLVKEFQKKVDKSDAQIKEIKESLDQVDEAAKDSSSSLKETSVLLEKSQTALGKFYKQFSNGLTGGEVFLDEVSSSASKSLNKFEIKADKANLAVGDSLDTITQINEKNAQLLKDLEKLNQNLGKDTQLSASVGQEISQLQTQSISAQKLVNSLKSANTSMRKVLKNSKDTRSSLETLAEDNRESFQDSRIDFSKNIYPQLDQSLEGLANVSGDLSTTLHSITSMTKQMRDLLDQLKSALHSSSKVLTQTGNVMGQVDQKLQKIVTDLQTLQNSDMYQNILSLEKIDAKDISNFMSSPVNIKTDVLYEVENYGTGMTPFYTNLALWVGGLILVSILKQEVDRDKEVPDFTPTSAYFGRILLFLIIGLIQGAIVCAGDIILLKVQCLHPVKFILAGMLTSFVYVNLIFALASTFKHMGKALAVLLVILQIPGSSGTYPIEMMPEFFQKLHPLLPFSYSISAMRECIAGYYHHTYRSSLGKLLVFLLVALFIGLVLRPLLMNLNHLFDVRLAETDLMIGETDSKGRDNPQLQRIMQVIMKDDAWRKKLTEKTLAFEKYYPVMVRSGFICMMVIPLVFLILMFSLESKLVYLILWIVSLLALILYLLIVEYLHEEMKKKSVLGEMSSEELMKILKEENSK